MSTEDDLRAALQDEARQYSLPSGLWARIASDLDHRAETKGRKAAWIAIAVGVVLTATVVIAVAAERASDQAARPSTSTVAPAAEATTTSTPAEVIPPRLIAARSSGEIVAVDAASQGQLLTLYEPAACATCRPPDSLVLAPGGATLFFHVADGNQHRILRVAAAGGPATPVAEGCEPAPSPDGRRLAFVACGASGDLVVQDLGSGQEQRFAPGPAGQTIAGVAWSSDGASLAYAAAAAGEPTQLWQLDLATARDQRAARLIGPPSAAPPGTSWGRPVARDGELAIVESCCTPATGTVNSSATVVVLDLSRARELKRFALGDTPPRALSFDATGRHALVVTADGDLYRRSGDGPLRRIGGGYRDAVWA